MRAATARLLLGAAMIAGTALLWPAMGARTLPDWLALAAVIGLTALVQGLRLTRSVGDITFLPVVALMAYMTLGLPASLIATGLGLLIGGIVLAAARRSPPGGPARWWELAGQAALPIGQNGLGLLAADFAFRSLGGSPPLTAVSSWPDMLPVVAAPVTYLLAYNLILIVDLLLGGVKLAETTPADRRTALAVQVLPTPLAPFAAIAYAQVGSPTLFLSALILLTLTIVVRRLMLAQDRLHTQVAQLRSFSDVSQALRTTLELEALLQAIYLQVGSLLKTRSLLIVLAHQQGDNPGWEPRFVARSGRIERDPATYPLDAFTRRVLEKHAPLLAGSVAQTALQLGIEAPPDAHSWMGVPLLSSSRLLGCVITWLETGQQPERAFNEDDLALFTAIAVQGEMAIENALLYEDAQRHAAQLARLNQISTVINASLDPQRLVEMVASSVIEVAGCDKAAVYMLEQGTENPALLLTHARGFSDEHIPRSRDIAVPISDDERRRVLEEGEALAVSNVHSRTASVSAAARLLAEQERFSAYAYLPLRAQKQVLGMLAIYYNRPRDFSETDLELLVTFANQAALAIANARVHQHVDSQLARRIGQMMHMSEISQRLSSTLDLSTIFSLIIETALEGCKADAGVLVLAGAPELGYDDGQPHMVAWRGFDPASSFRAPHRIAEELANSEVFERGEARLRSMDDPYAAGPRSQLSAPIFLEGRVIGAIGLESEMLDAFSEEDLRFVSQLAVQAALAIRNAQLYSHVESVRDRLHAILDASNDGLLMIDPKGRIIMTNTRMGDFWDFARQDFDQRSPDQFAADPLSGLGEGLGYKEGELSALVRRGLTTSGMKPKTDLYSTRAASGQRQRYVERTATPVRDERGNFIGLLLLFRDVTEQKELEDTRQNLTNMIVHDLRSPLQAVMGSMRLIAEVSPEDDPIIEQATDVSKRAVKKLLNLVNNLLDLSRMEQGEFVLDTAIEEVRPLLEDSIEELKPLAQEMGVVVRLELPDDLPGVQADRDMIGRVMLNLLDNALKFTEPGTLVTVGAGLHQSGGQPDEMVRVWVMDEGPGVPDEFKELIFDRFAQVPGRRGRRRSAGLGLAFCRLAVEAHNGRIWVEDNPRGQGSRFCFSLPAVRLPAASPDEEAKHRPAEAALAAPDRPPPPAPGSEPPEEAES